MGYKEREGKGKGFLCLMSGGTVAEAGYSCQWGTNGEGLCLVQGVLSDVMLSIPLMQGTKGVLPHGNGHWLYSFCRLGTISSGFSSYMSLAIWGNRGSWCAVSILLGRGTTLTIMGINSRTSQKWLSKSQ